MHGSRWLAALMAVWLALVWPGGAGAEEGQADAAPQPQPYIVPAGRSPIPQPGEQITRPLPLQRFEVWEPAQHVEPPAPGQVIPWDQAANYLGYEITVEGTIVDTHMIGSGAICFLNFDKDWRGKFYLAVFKEAFGDLPRQPQDYFMGKKLRVTGEVKLHKNVPQMEVHKIGQVELVE